MKAWYQIPIVDNNEKLISVPCNIKLIEPHPYLTLGAPYQNKSNLWSLRESVVLRLIKADKYLKTINKEYSLILYDTYRPIEVQSFMFYLSFKNECKKRGLRISNNDMNSYPEIIKEVEKFWAYPCFDNKSPPPHSTGGAIDLGIIDNSGRLIDMGCEIDAMHKSARPDFYNNYYSEEAKIWKKRRIILKQVMSKFGFVQHPNEWWHFSYGDQLWAWINSNKNAIYGRIK